MNHTENGLTINKYAITVVGEGWVVVGEGKGMHCSQLSWMEKVYNIPYS